MPFYVASHKHIDLNLPSDYQPLFVGAANHADLERVPEWLYDDEAPSISAKNKSFCELTGLYWAWKHSDADTIGLLHYRRFFKDDTTGEALSFQRAQEVLADHDAIVAKRTVLFDGTYLLNIARHYRIYHSAIDYRILRTIIAESYPDYLNAFDTCSRRTWLHACNLLMMKRPLFDEYCSFLFGVLGKVEHAIDPYSFRPDYQQRVFGFLGERLLNVFLEANRLTTYEFPIFDPSDTLTADENPSTANINYPPDPRPPFIARFFKPTYQGTDLSSVFDAEFALSQWRFDEGIPKHKLAQTAFDFFLRTGATCHPRFSVSSYAKAHATETDNSPEDIYSWCVHYLDHTPAGAIDPYAFGFENFDFGLESKRDQLEDTLGIDGEPLRCEDFDEAHIRAAKQGIVG